MSNEQEPIETYEGPEITDEEIAGFIERGGQEEEPKHRPILAIWREVLSNIETEAEKKVTPLFASRIVGSYPGVTFATMEDYRDIYFGRLKVLRALVQNEIDANEDALKPTTVEEDREENSSAYKNLLFQVQLQLRQWELEWETTSPDAAVELAALGEIHKMFFGIPGQQQGLTGHLEYIGLEFTEADQEMLVEALEELKAGQ